MYTVGTGKTATTYMTCAETAALVRKALKANWPAVKFSVRSSVYSGGASINVDWTEGPLAKEVEPVAKQYEGANFDGMIDLKSYVEHIVDGKRIHYGADYIFCTRYTQAERDQNAQWAAEYAARKQARTLRHA